jgi:hypothetical protein
VVAVFFIAAAVAVAVFAVAVAVAFAVIVRIRLLEPCELRLNLFGLRCLAELHQLPLFALVVGVLLPDGVRFLKCLRELLKLFLAELSLWLLNRFVLHDNVNIDVISADFCPFLSVSVRIWRNYCGRLKYMAYNLRTGLTYCDSGVFQKVVLISPTAASR